MLSFMTQNYQQSKTTMTERIAMGGSSKVCKAKAKKIKDGKEKEAKKAVDEFDAKWERASGGQ